MQTGLDDFLQLYPECPLWRFMPGKPAGAVDISYLERFESRLGDLGDKRSRLGVLVQAQAVYIAFVSGRMKVVRGLALADFPEVVKYPDTPRSLEVGAAICATVNLLGGQMLPEYVANEWVLYFWRRSFDLRPFKFDHLDAL